MRIESAQEPISAAPTELIERLVSLLIYLVTAAAIVIFGVSFLNRSAICRFVNDYMLAWEVAALQFDARQGVWPPDIPGRREEYMAELAGRMERSGVAVPLSNGRVKWHYRISLIGRAPENVFVLVRPGSIFVYGLSPQSAARMDEMVDGRRDAAGGKVLIRQGRNERQVVVRWLR